MLNKENGFTLPFFRKFPQAKKYAFAFISLFALLLAIYSNSFNGDWHFDDFANIVENPYIKISSFSFPEVKQLFSDTYQYLLLRPLSYLSFALNYSFGGLNVFGFHVVNVTIHFLSSIFLFLFLINTLKLPRLKEQYASIAYPVALIATFFWAVHPLWVTSVTYIVQRMTCMAAMFYILSLYFYLKARTADKIFPAITFFLFCTLSALASFLTKENAVMLPVCIIFYDLFLIQGISKDNLKKFLKISILPIIAIAIIGFFYTNGFSKILDGYDVRDFTLVQRLLTEPRIILFYLSLLVYPIHSRLTFLYDIQISSSLFSPWTTAASMIVIILIIVSALFLARKRPLISFCILFFFLNHLVESSFIPLELIYEHRNYLPAMLLFVPVAQFILYVVDFFSYKRFLQVVVSLIIALIIFGLGDVTYRRNEIVSNEFLFWLDNAEKYPNLSRPHTNLGLFYLERNLVDKGLFHFQKALQLNNFSNKKVRDIQYQNLGVYYFHQKQYDLALQFLKKNSTNYSSKILKNIFISKIYLLRNNFSEARRLLQNSLVEYPDNTALKETLCLLLLKEKQYTDSEILAKKLLQDDLSNSFPLAAMAEIQRQKGNFRSAVLYWELYQKSLPADPYANLALIELYSAMKEGKKLNTELSKLYCLKKTMLLRPYLELLSQNQNLLVYVPNSEKIRAVIQATKAVSP